MKVDHPDPGFGAICPHEEGKPICMLCKKCPEHCNCKRNP